MEYFCFIISLLGIKFNVYYLNDCDFFIYLYFSIS